MVRGTTPRWGRCECATLRRAALLRHVGQRSAARADLEGSRSTGWLCGVLFLLIQRSTAGKAMQRAVPRAWRLPLEKRLPLMIIFC